MTNSVFTDESLNSFASNSTSNNFFKKTKNFSHEPNTPVIAKRMNHFKFDAATSSYSDSTKKRSSPHVYNTISKSFNIGGDFSSEQEVDSNDDDIPNATKKSVSRVGSLRLNNSNGPSIYFIKNKNLSQKDMNSSYNPAFENGDDNDNTIGDNANNTQGTVLATNQSMRVDSVPKNSILRKSQVID